MCRKMNVNLIRIIVHNCCPVVPAFGLPQHQGITPMLFILTHAPEEVGQNIISPSHLSVEWLLISCLT